MTTTVRKCKNRFRININTQNVLTFSDRVPPLPLSWVDARQNEQSRAHSQTTRFPFFPLTILNTWWERFYPEDKGVDWALGPHAALRGPLLYVGRSTGRWNVCRLRKYLYCAWYRLGIKCAPNYDNLSFVVTLLLYVWIGSLQSHFVMQQQTSILVQQQQYHYSYS